MPASYAVHLQRALEEEILALHARLVLREAEIARLKARNADWPWTEADVQRCRNAGAATLSAALRNEALQILGFDLSVNPSSEEIRKAYIRRIKGVHPDQGGTSQDFVAVRKAYEHLMKGDT